MELTADLWSVVVFGGASAGEAEVGLAQVVVDFRGLASFVDANCWCRVEAGFVAVAKERGAVAGGAEGLLRVLRGVVGWWIGSRGAGARLVVLFWFVVEHTHVAEVLPVFNNPIIDLADGNSRRGGQELGFVVPVFVAERFADGLREFVHEPGERGEVIDGGLSFDGGDLVERHTDSVEFRDEGLSPEGIRTAKGDPFDVEFLVSVGREEAGVHILEKCVPGSGPGGAEVSADVVGHHYGPAVSIKTVQDASYRSGDLSGGDDGGGGEDFE